MRGMILETQDPRLRTEKVAEADEIYREADQGHVS